MCLFSYLTIIMILTVVSCSLFREQQRTNQHIRMISVTLKTSNDAENSALHHKNKLHFKTYSNRKQFFEIYIFTVFLIK